jgi:outer membrane protein assembly factor BamB
VDDGTAWVTEAVPGGVQITRFDGDKQTSGATSTVIAGTPGTPATVLGGDKIFVHTRLGDQTRLVALSSRTLLALPQWSLAFGASTLRDIAFTDPLYFAAADGPQQGFWEAPFVRKTTYPATKARQISTLPTYKVSTTNAHAWALSTAATGSVLSRYDRSTGSIGDTIVSDLPADKVSVMVVDNNYIWLVADNKISVYGPS